MGTCAARRVGAGTVVPSLAEPPVVEPVPVTKRSHLCRPTRLSPRRNGSCCLPGREVVSYPAIGHTVGGYGNPGQSRSLLGGLAACVLLSIAIARGGPSADTLRVMTAALASPGEPPASLLVDVDTLP